ncbi:hypothetical protein HDU67_000147 [Dinochytrium kinnereticum]|nr:hypothetical protein HDU67_000147 [Dinochytrium kinnereticum]
MEASIDTAALGTAAVALAYLCVFAAPAAASNSATSSAAADEAVDETTSLLPHPSNASAVDPDEGWEVMPMARDEESGGFLKAWASHPLMGTAFRTVVSLIVIAFVVNSAQWCLIFWMFSGATYASAAVAGLVFAPGLLAATLITRLLLFTKNTFSPVTVSVRTERAKAQIRASLYHLSFFFSFVSFLAFYFLQDATESFGSYVIAMTICLMVEGAVLAGLSGWCAWGMNVGTLLRKPVDGIVPCPETESSFFSRATFSWMNPLMSKGNNQPLYLNDLYNVGPEERTEYCMLAYESAVSSSLKKPSLAGALWTLHWWSILMQFGLSLAGTLLFFANVWFFATLLKEVPEVGVSGSWVYALIIGMVGTATIKVFADTASTLLGRKIGMRIRNVLCALIYRKSLRRVPKVPGGGDPSSTKENDSGASAGKIANLMSVDATSVGDWVAFIGTPVITGLQILLCVGALIYILGWPSLPGIFVLTVLLFSGSPLAKSVNSGYVAIKEARDNRVNAFNEVMQGIKIIKFFAWEPQFMSKVEELRQKELSVTLKTNVLYTATRVLWYAAPFLTTLVVLGVYTAVAGHQLTATVAFTALSLFSFLKGPIQMFPDTIVQLLDSWISLRRIATFLEEEELQDLKEPSHLPSASDPILGFTDASFAWEKAKDEPALTVPQEKWKWFSGFGRGQKVDAEVATVVSDETSSQGFELRDLNVVFPEGKLTVSRKTFITIVKNKVVGATGSGKSSLLQALLGEMHRTKGYLHRPRQSPIAYVPQVAWLTNATIRDNITFGTRLDEDRYRRVVRACALERDLGLLEGGDLTEVGEKGINLSGGQKQRIAVARACYSGSGIAVLDDPLSAVDAPTARFIMEECVMGILSDRTRILVTNAISLAIPRADYLIVMNAGRVLYQGSVEEVLASISSVFYSSTSSTVVGSPLLSPGGMPSSSSALLSDTEALSAFVPFIEGLRDITDSILAERLNLGEGGYAAKQELEEAYDDLEATEELFKKKPKNSGVLVNKDAGTRLVEDEKMEEGQVGLEVYGFYYKAVGGWFFLSLLLLGYSVNHFSVMGLDWIVLKWIQAYEELGGWILPGFSLANVPAVTVSSMMMPIHNGTISVLEFDPVARIYIPFYAAVMVIALASTLGRFLVLWYGNISAGRCIHKVLLRRVLGSPLRFFEVTPIGRIVNRFTKDMAAADFEVGVTSANFFYNVVMIIFIVGSISIVIPQLLLAMIPVAFVYFKIGQFYLRASRSLKRIDSITRSPIFSHFSETINGAIVIRAFNDAHRFTEDAWQKFDSFNRSSYFSGISFLWLSIRVQVLGALIMLLAADLVVYAGVGRNLTGLCLNFAFGLTNALIGLVTNQSWYEMCMNSIERLYEYTQIEQEAPAIVPTNRPPQNWPSEGRISIQDLRFKYAPDLPEVLRGLSAEIGSREKVGIVGRTGAGKSSMALALFRMVEPSGGRVTIDGVDVSEIGLADLRGGLTIIPQDPILFTGTVRSNLDPFGTVPDADLWAALKRSHLISTSGEVAEISTVKEALSDDSMPTSEDSKMYSDVQITLETAVAEGGANLSAGQRQLLCLARALARRTRVIVMDEATASVDTETDSRIQETIRSEFNDCTVITIAHRLKTIADYDRVIVLDAGRVIENGSPLELIERSKIGVFRNMCEETGEFEELVSIARNRESKTL